MPEAVRDGIQAFIKEAHLDALDMAFVFSRLQTVSPYGERSRRALKPLLPDAVQELERLYDELESAMAVFERRRGDVLEIKHTLKELKFLGATFDRLAEGETLSITELFEVKGLSMSIDTIRRQLEAIHWDREVGVYVPEDMAEVTAILDPERSGVRTFYIYAAYSERLADIRRALEAVDRAQKAARRQCIAALNADGIAVPENGELRVPVRDAAMRARVQEDDRLVYRSDMGMYSVFAVRMDAPLEQRREALLEAEEAEEYAVRAALSEALRNQLPLLRQNTAHMGALDLLIAKTQFAVAFRCVRPKLDVRSDAALVIKGGRHLKVEWALERAQKRFTPIDITLKTPVAVITGANMGGKTVSLKLIGQVQVMAQYGLFVPCVQARLPVLNGISVSIGDFQSVDMGLSTFGGEIVEVQQALERIQRDPRGRYLLLIDELSRGTNPLEGFALSKALIEALARQRVLAAVTTHFDGLTRAEGVTHYQVIGLSDVDLDQMRQTLQTKGVGILHEHMDYRLAAVDGAHAIPKEAVKIAALMGLDTEVIKRARELLGGAYDT